MMKKRSICVWVAMFVLVSVIHTVNIHAMDKSDVINNLSVMMSKYPDGSKWCGTYYANDGSEGPWECFGFACEIFRGIFGCEMPRAYTNDMWHFANTNNVICVGSIASPSESDVKNLLSTAKPGDIIQARGAYQHTMVVTNASDVGINIFDANYDGNNTIRTNGYLSHGAIASQYYVGLSLYRYNNYPSDITVPDVPTGALSMAWGDRVQIQWNTVNNADSYECGLIDVETKEIVLKITTNNWYHNFYKVPEGDYYAYVCAKNSAGASRHSNWMYTTVAWYNVVYNYNDGSNVSSLQTKYCDTNLILSSDRPSRDGYTFKNWNTKSDGTGTTYKPGDLYTSNASVTLYAQWEKINSYTKTKVIDYNIYKLCNAEIFNIDISGSIIISSYKNGKMVSCEMRDLMDGSESFAVFGDIDEIKVMVWDGLSTMKPLCDAEVIPSSEWITQ